MYMISDGIAINSPTTVVNSARPMPAANSSDFPIAAFMAIVVERFHHAHTVPSRPNSGPTVAAPLRTRR